MRFWLREVIGWALVLAGLVVFYTCYTWLRGHHIVEAGALTVIGFILFRGGIHLLKVAIAAQACRDVQEKIDRAAPGAARPNPPQATSTPRWLRRPKSGTR